MTTPWYRTGRGLAVVAVYGLLTVAAVLASTGRLLDATASPPDATALGPARVPAYVYVYAFLGGMAYAFTSLVARFDRGPVGALRVGVRAVAALPLAAGVYLLVGLLGVESVGVGDVRLLAGLAFLVGLYVNLTLKALGGLADRLYGRTPE